MEDKENRPDFTYGASHSRFYNPSIVSDVRFSRDDRGNTVQVHSDVYFLLRQSDLERRIGTESVKYYLDSMAARGEVPARPSDLSDDDLFALIPNKAVNNMTTAYQAGLALEANHKEVKKNYTTLMDKYKQYRDWTHRIKADK